MNLIFKRILAFGFDYFVIISYAIILFLLSNFLLKDINFNSLFYNQLLSFSTLTLPVFLYFYFSEKSYRKATFGKRLLKIKVCAFDTNKRDNIFLRNFVKFLPWEIAHIGVYQIYYFENNNLESPLYVWILLIVPQIIVLIYFINILKSKGKSSFYDKISNVEIKTLT